MRQSKRLSGKKFVMGILAEDIVTDVAEVYTN